VNQDRICGQCRAPLAPDVRFCTMCGHPVEPSVPPAASTPPSRAGGALGPIVLVLVLLICGGGAFMYRGALLRLLRPTPVAVTPPATNGAASTIPAASPAGETAPSTNTAPPATEPDQQPLSPQDAATYLPLPYRSYRYHEWYPDGDNGEWIQITASLKESLPVSTIEILAGPPESDPIAYHYLQKGGAIYRVADIRPRQAELLLSGPLKVGTVIKSIGVIGTVTAMDATCTTGGSTYQHCLVIARNYTAAGDRNIEYWAPGYGIVLVKSPSGTPVRTLLSVKSIDVQQAVDRVQKASPNIDKVRLP